MLALLLGAPVSEGPELEGAALVTAIDSQIVDVALL
jgi:hypothetical protein